MYSAIVTSRLDKRKRFFQKEGKTCLDLGHFIKNGDKAPKKPKTCLGGRRKEVGSWRCLPENKTFLEQKKDADLMTWHSVHYRPWKQLGEASLATCSWSSGQPRRIWTGSGILQYWWSSLLDLSTICFHGWAFTTDLNLSSLWVCRHWRTKKEKFHFHPLIL